MDIYACISILTMFTVALSLWKYRKPKDYQYSLLDISAIILNVVLGMMIYPPFCVLCGLMATGEYTDQFPIVLEGAAIVLSRLLPAVCVGSIGASIVLRRREKPTAGFLVQFAGAAWFCIIMMLAS